MWNSFTSEFAVRLFNELQFPKAKPIWLGGCPFFQIIRNNILLAMPIPERNCLEGLSDGKKCIWSDRKKKLQRIKRDQWHRIYFGE
jgi:hypothetical protein